ncbi:MAG: hypothetical protein ACRDL8_07895, partial [Solirubrobacteraceae bacterium]
MAKAVALIRQAVAAMHRVLATTPPEGLSHLAAHELTCEAGVLEKVAAAATLRFARAAGREAPLLLASATGTATGTARRRLDVANRVSTCAPLAEAFRRGDLSVDQAGALAPLAASDPRAAEALFGTAAKLSVKELRAEAARLVHQLRGELDAVRSERVLHARRYCRTWIEPGGGVRLDARVGPRDGAALLTALRHEHERLRLRRAAGTPASVAPGAAGGLGSGDAMRAHLGADQLRADALVRLVTGRASTQRSGPPELLIRVDAAALLRGEVAHGEMCEIAGTGPVSVGVARSLLGEALWTLLVTSGTDIRTVTTTTRAIPKKVRSALLLRDRECVVPGCGETETLEIDHWKRDFSWHGAT